jgi:CHAT domain-containing protein/Flp pilus assembly protein TadD
MRHPAKLLGLAVLAAAITSATQTPGFSQEPRNLEDQPQALWSLFPKSTAFNLNADADRLIQQGNQHVRSGQFDAALETFEQALNIYRQIEDHQGEADALTRLGTVHHIHFGNYGQALRFYEQALAIIRNFDTGLCEVCALSRLGDLYSALGQPILGIDFYDQALTVARKIGDRSREVIALNNLGNGYYSLAQYNLAIDFLQQALAVSNKTSNQQGKAAALNDLGNIYSTLGQYDRAIDFYLQALIIIRGHSTAGCEGCTLGNLGIVYAALGNYEQAIDLYEQALTSAQASSNAARERLWLSKLGHAFYPLDQPELATVFLKAFVELNEATRSDIRELDTTLQQSFISTIADDYRFLANILLQQGRIPEAQQVLDLLQLEELREFTHTRAAWNGTALAFTDPEQTVIDAHGSLIALGGRILECEATNCADLDDYYAQMEALKEQYDRQVEQFVETIRAHRAADDVFQDPDTLSGDAENLLAAYAEAGETAVLIYPFVLQDKLWLVWATAGNVIGSVEVPVPQGELSAAVQRFGELLNRPGAGSLTDLQAASQRLYSWIVQPLEEELEKTGVDHLIFVNDRVTRYIPMAALFDGERFLLERYRISTVLSPAVTETGGRLGPVDDSQVLGLGLTQAVADFSPLPAVAEELKAIVRDDSLGAEGIFPGRVFLDDDFTLDALRDNVMHHRVLHMATHAAFVPGRAQDSFIVLGNGDRLSIPDINTIERRLRNLHLVVLSACQTALGGPAADGNGTEIAGLSSYFLRPGRAETVIASLWKVNDDSTSVLMQRFYELLATGELTKAEALRQAQISLLYNEDAEIRLAASRGNIVVETRDGTPLSAVGSQHPYHWAPFILIGNGL